MHHTGSTHDDHLYFITFPISLSLTILGMISYSLFVKKTGCLSLGNNTADIRKPIKVHIKNDLNIESMKDTKKSWFCSENKTKMKKKNF